MKIEFFMCVGASVVNMARKIQALEYVLLLLKATSAFIAALYTDTGISQNISLYFPCFLVGIIILLGLPWHIGQKRASVDLQSPL